MSEDLKDEISQVDTSLSVSLEILDVCFHWEQVEWGNLSGNLSSVIYCMDATASSSGEE